MPLPSLPPWRSPPRSRRNSPRSALPQPPTSNPSCPRWPNSTSSRPARTSPPFGSSATLAQQITNGAPVDLFLSADCAHPEQLATAGLVATPVPYATGELVLWARKDSPAQPLSLESLSSARVSHIAVANDRHAPYGQAATSELEALQLKDKLTPKLVIGENILQTAQFADTGNAQAAFISLTIASSPHFRETGSFLSLPKHYPPIRQCGAALAHGTNTAVANSFLQWLTSPDIQKRFKQFGLSPASH